VEEIERRDNNPVFLSSRHNEGEEAEKKDEIGEHRRSFGPKIAAEHECYDRRKMTPGLIE
jgi:hypothetical protein